MALVWHRESFRETISKKYPGQTAEAMVKSLGLEQWELEVLLAATPPADATLAPHPDEVRYLESRLSVSAKGEGWIDDDPELANLGIEESYPVLQAEPVGQLGKGTWSRRSEAQREFFALFAALAQRVWICGVGQKLRFTDKGIRFLALDAYGVHAYVSAGSELGLTVRELSLWETVTIPRRRRWLRDDLV